MRVAKAVKLDQIDAERLRELFASQPFALVNARIQNELDRAIATCERSDVPVEISRAQGAIAALRTVLAMPKRILEEIQRAAR